MPRCRRPSLALLPLPPPRADKSHFQDGLIQFSTDFYFYFFIFLFAGAGDVRLPSRRWAARDSPAPAVIRAAQHRACHRRGGGRILPCRAPQFGIYPWGGGRRNGGGAQRWHPGGAGAAGGAVRGGFCFVPLFLLVFFFFPPGLMSTSGSLSLSVFSSLLPFRGKWLTDCFSSPALRSCKSYFIQTSITGT